MEIFIKVLQFILSFSLLVFIHELGHFLFAHMFGIRVDKFYIFFNPWFSLVKFKIGHTEYGIGWIPFGGYCKIAGMIDESLDTEQMAKPPQPWEFRSKPAWQRLLVMLGGVLMNVLLAVCIYIGMTWKWGDSYIANDDLKYGWTFNEMAHEIGFRDGDRILTVGGQPVEKAGAVFVEIMIGGAPDVVVERDGRRENISIPVQYVERMLESPDFMLARMPFVLEGIAEEGGAATAGLMPGDSLVAVNGEPAQFYNEFTPHFKANKDKEIELTLIRNGEERTVPVAVSVEGHIGVYPYSLEHYIAPRTKSYTFLESVPQGIKRTGNELSSYWKQIKMVFQPKTKAYKSLGGPIMIFRIFPSYWSWATFWSLTAFLSIILAVMNILPIPGLDGGHVMFVLYEMITGRKPGDRFLEIAQITGLLLLLVLFIYATGNDIQRLFK